MIAGDPDTPPAIRVRACRTILELGEQAVADDDEQLAEVRKLFGEAGREHSSGEAPGPEGSGEAAEGSGAA
jgi:hypothetical protein